MSVPIVHLQAEAIAHPGVIIALPFVAMAWVAFMIPLLMFCTYNVSTVRVTLIEHSDLFRTQCQESSRREVPWAVIPFTYQQSIHSLASHCFCHRAAMLSQSLLCMPAQADFKGLNPIIPTHYLHIARKAYRAFSNNNMRVREKDL
jgi:hypothetical protein